MVRIHCPAARSTIPHRIVQIRLPSSALRSAPQLAIPPLLNEIFQERQQTRKAVVGVHVLFDHVEGKVVGPAESPDAQS